MSVTPRRPLVVQPHPYIGDVSGRPLDGGMIYFGEPDKDPQDYPITVYLDPEQTKPAHQPIRTKGGFINVFGDITEIFADEILYSLKVLDCYGRLVFYKKRMHRDDITEELGMVKAVTSNTYYASLEGFKTTAEQLDFDNSAIWYALQEKMSDGDSLVFPKGEFIFKQSFEIYKQICITGADGMGTKLSFNNQTSGVVRYKYGSHLRNLAIIGQSTETELNPLSRVFGTVGITDEYGSQYVPESEHPIAGKGNASGVDTYKCEVQRFDCGRVNASYIDPSPSSSRVIWNGAYRETVFCNFRNNRIGLVFLNGSTHDKYYGGVVQGNKEVGIWSYSDSVTNNIVFYGTTIETNGNDHPDADRKHSSSVGYSKLTSKTCGVYSGGNSSLSLIGTYLEMSATLANKGGVVNFIGSHNHYNAPSFADTAGRITFSGMHSSHGSFEILLPLYPRLTTWFYGLLPSKKSLVDLDGTTTAAYLGYTEGADYYAIRTRDIKINSPLLVEEVKTVSISLSSKVLNGLALNPGATMSIDPVLKASDGSEFTVRTITAEQTTLSTEKKHIQVVSPVSVSNTVTSGFLTAGKQLESIVLKLTIRNPEGNIIAVAGNPFKLVLDDLAIAVYTDRMISMPAEIKVNEGIYADIPSLVKGLDNGYRYKATDVNRTYEFIGNKWQTVAESFSATAAELSDKSSVVNTVDKFRGRLVFNSSDTRYYIATGETSTASWKCVFETAASITPI